MMGILRWLAVSLAVLLSACGSGSDDVAPADINLVVGQADFVSGLANQGGTPDANTLDTPGDLAIRANRLYIADSANHRILGFDAIPTTNNAVADFVLGQAGDFTTDSPGTSVSTLNNPSALATSTSKLAVSDELNNRVLIWNALPAGDVNPNVVLGQGDFDSSASACTATGLNAPRGLIITNNGKLIVADTGNNRVLIWSTVPTSLVSANIVLGQTSPTVCTAGVTDSKLNAPSGVWSDGARLVVNDTGNNRVLIWNSFPTPTGSNEADIVLGQGDFTFGDCNDDDQNETEDDDPTQKTLCGPGIGVVSDGTQLIVADKGNHRLMVWETFPTVNFQLADVALGQTDFTNNAYNDSDQDGLTDVPPTPSGATLYGPQGLRINGKLLFITDTSNHRVRIIE